MGTTRDIKFLVKLIKRCESVFQVFKSLPKLARALIFKSVDTSKGASAFYEFYLKFLDGIAKALFECKKLNRADPHKNNTRVKYRARYHERSRLENEFI